METLDAVRDWLAKDDGWYFTGKIRKRWFSPNIRDAWHGTSIHPHPPTLDGAAAALPEGWGWNRTTHDGENWSAFSAGHHLIVLKDTGNEIEDRYRLAKAARIATKGAGR